MRILVTGGAGFIGSHLCEHLVSLRHDICVFDNLNDCYSVECKRLNLEQIRSVGHFDFVHGDICDAECVKAVFRTFRPQALIHLAARAGVRPSVATPLVFEKVNIRGILVLLEQCRAARVQKSYLLPRAPYMGSKTSRLFEKMIQHSRSLPTRPRR